MKRIFALVITALLFIMGKSQIKNPDFAYPKTTAENAEKALKSAIDRQDANDAINALIVYTVAEFRIDPTELQRSIRLIEDTSEKFQDSELYGLFDALLARMYMRFYNEERWVYNRRKLPLTPLPADLTEWSGDQFRAKVKELSLKSIAPQNIAKLAKLKIDAYPDIVVCKKASVPLFPTLADFAYYNCVEMLKQCLADTQEIKGIYEQALTSSIGHSGAEAQWQCQIDNLSDNAFEALKASYSKSTDSFGGLYLPFIAKNANDIQEKAQFKALAQEYLQKYPTGELREYVEFYYNVVVCPSIEVTTPQLCAKGATFKANVRNQNAAKYKVNAYYISENEPNNKTRQRINSIIKTNKPEVSIPIVCNTPTPFEEETIVDICLDRPGYYAIVPVMEGIENPKYVSYVRCIPVMPFTVNGADNMGQIVVVNPETGAPVTDADVRVSTTKNTIFSGKTNSIGVSDVTAKDIPWNAGINIGFKGKTYHFDNPSLDIETPDIEEDDTDIYAQILTDRGIYHPSDEVNVLAVCYSTTAHVDKTQTQKLMVDMEVRFDVLDANWQRVDTLTAKTDEYGRAITTFTLPTEGLTGNYQIRCYVGKSRSDIGSKSIMVSDFKMPDFELTIETIECDVPAKGDVTITGNATTYSGMPMADTKLTLNLNKASWWRWRDDSAPFYSTEITTGYDGKFSHTIPDSVFTENPSVLYRAVIDAVSANGSTATDLQTFARTQKYNIEVTVADANVDGEKPLKPNVEVTAPNGDKVEIPLRWMLKAEDDTIASGDYTGEIDLQKIKPGKYTLAMQSKEEGLTNTATTDITVYNIASGITPSEELWVKEKELDVKGTSKCSITLATGLETTYLYYSIVSDGSIVSTQMVKYPYGYHTLDINLPEDMEKGKILLCCVNGCQASQEDISITHAKASGLKIEGEAFRDMLIPGAPETWSLRIVGADGKPLQGAIALDMYNKALDALYPHTYSLRFRKHEFYSHVYYNTPSNYSNSNGITGNVKAKNKSLTTPDFNTYGFLYGNSALLWIGVSDLYGYSSGPVYKSMAIEYDADMEDAYISEAPVPTGAPVMMNAARSMNAPMMAEEAKVETEEEEMDGGNAAEAEFEYREAEVPLAIWAPTLTTDAQGNVQYTFTVPNATTTWRLKAVAWTKDMEVGELMREFVASKPLMVQPNLPRFLRTGDTATVLATVMNNSDEQGTVTTTIEIFNPLNGEIITKETYTNELGAKQSATVGIDISAADGLAAIGYRVKATNGRFSDGEQKAIRILPSESSLIETKPFYLNPGEKTYSTKLPKEKDARLSLTFCENPVWTIVSALPGLRTQICDYANSAAAALYSAAIAQGIVKDNPEIGKVLKAWSENPDETALTSMLEKNEDLKIALLNATPWVLASQSDNERMANLSMIFDTKETSASIAKALEILEKLQKADGGWAWGKWCNESSMWVTANVLSMLGDLKHSGWLPADKKLDAMTAKAVKYYDNKVKDTDLLYCLIRPYFSNISVSDNGKKVIKATLAEIRKDWKKNSDPAYKAMQAEALYLNGDASKAHELMRSLSEFGVYTQSQGLKFPSVNALYNYAIILEAYGMIEPESREVDGLRQQLIVRKQGTDWGSAVVTTEVVRSILTTGTRWTVEAQGADIQVGDETITPNTPIEEATGSLTADLSAYGGKKLTITTPGIGPTYGAVYAQFKKQMTEVKASSCDDLDIEKQLYVRQGTEWAEAKDLKVGDRVKVQLTIHCKRNLQYVSIIDERPAAFEPVEQLPGWVWSEGVAFYRENRDAQTDLHVVYMSPGTYLLTYEMNVNTAGTYSSGVATIQSQYAPELSAHSSGCILKVEVRGKG